MKVNEELIGKEVIDDTGDQVGVVKDVDLNAETFNAEFIVLAEGGLSTKLGLGDKTLVPIDMVKTIGDKVLIKGNLLKNKDN